MYRFKFNGLDIIAISDTHGEHRKLEIPPCDLLIHLGDVCNFGNIAEIKDFMEWFVEQPAINRIFIAGNHDTCFEAEFGALIAMIPDSVCFMDNCKAILTGDDDKKICIAALPVRLGDIGSEWVDLENVDILLTHCPPFTVFDEGYGSRRLLDLVGKHQPTYHLFGHVHYDEPCMKRCGKTTYVNVSQKH